MSTGMLTVPLWPPNVECSYKNTQILTEKFMTTMFLKLLEKRMIVVDNFSAPYACNLVTKQMIPLRCCQQLFNLYCEYCLGSTYTKNMNRRRENPKYFFNLSLWDRKFLMLHFNLGIWPGSPIFVFIGVFFNNTSYTELGLNTVSFLILGCLMYIRSS